MSFKAPKDYRAFLKTWGQTGNIEESMLAAGYSPQQARKGKKGLPKKLRAIVEGDTDGSEIDIDQLKEYAEMVSDPAEAEKIIKGKLVEKLLQGQSVESISKVLGQLNSLSLFERNVTKDAIDQSTAEKLAELAERLIELPLSQNSAQPSDIPTSPAK